MSNVSCYSDEQLNALIDNELESEEKNELLQAIASDPDLQQRVESLRRTKEQFILAYTEVPQPIQSPQARWKYLNQPQAAIAIVLLLLLMFFVGTLLGPLDIDSNSRHIQTITEFETENPQSNTILFHVSTIDDSRVRAILNQAEALLSSARNTKTPLQIEIVANVEGLNILRQNSPYADEIHSLSNQFDNVKFLACGIAKRTAALKEGRPIVLLPEANDIPAALDQILNRLKQGWTYVKG